MKPILYTITKTDQGDDNVIVRIYENKTTKERILVEQDGKGNFKFSNKKYIIDSERKDYHLEMLIIEHELVEIQACSIFVMKKEELSYLIEIYNSRLIYEDGKKDIHYVLTPENLCSLNKNGREFFINNIDICILQMRSIISVGERFQEEFKNLLKKYNTVISYEEKFIDPRNIFASMCNTDPHILISNKESELVYMSIPDTDIIESNAKISNRRAHGEY